MIETRASVGRTLTASEIRELGEVLFGASWQGGLARAIGVPRQSVSRYLKTDGVRGAQTAVIVGLVARTAARELLAADQQQIVFDARQAELIKLLRRFDSR